MVNWNSKFAQIGERFTVSLEVVKVVDKNGVFSVTAKLVDLPVGVVAKDVVLKMVSDKKDE